MPALTVELIHSRAPLFGEPLPAAALEWATALTAAALPEAQPYPRLYAALDGVLDAIEAAPAARGWAVALVRYELLLLAELGFGLDLDALRRDRAQRRPRLCQPARAAPRSAALARRI